MLIAFLLFAHADPSALYGVDGVDWDPLGRLPDFSYAGYRAGEHPLPEPAVVADVTDFGAVGDGITDDTAAFQAAIDATSGGAVSIGAGTWRIEGELHIRDGDIVLRGAGAETVLDFPNSLTDIRGAAPQWSWNGGLIQVEPRSNPADITDVVVGAVRGDRTLTVEDASALSAGDLVVLSLVDGGDGSLGSHLHNDQFPGGSCAYQVPMTLDWPVRIASVDGTTVTLAQPLRVDARLAWSPRLRSHPTLSDVGVEHLTIRFPDTEYAGHLDEPGYNGIFFTRGVVDSWVRDVTFVNADNAVLVDRLSKHHTITDIRIEGRKGHHGLNIAFAADGLYDGLEFQADFVHHITVDHRANGNVFKNVVGAAEVHLDHHRDAPFENLFSNFDAEISFFHGGNLCAGHPSGARETLWGLPGPILPPYWIGAQGNAVGSWTIDDTLTDDAEWVETVDHLQPADLHAHQRAKRLDLPIADTAMPQDTDADTTAPPEDTGCGCAVTRFPLAPGPLLLLGLLVVRRRRN